MQFIGEPYKAGGNIGSLDHGENMPIISSRKVTAMASFAPS